MFNPERYGIVFAVYAALLLAAAPSFAQDGAPSAVEASAEELKTLGLLTRQLRSDLRDMERANVTSRPHTVEEALKLVAGAKTPANIYRWVRDTIDFEPYNGALRGPSGALVAGSANSIDQALLLSAMLREAGFKTRFVSGTVHANDAVDVLRRFAGSATLIAPGDEALAATLRADDVSDSTRYTQLVHTHVWVEVEEDGQFRAADPVLSPLFGMTPAVADQRSETLPEDFATSMEIQLVSHLTDGQESVVLTVSGPLSLYAYRAISLGFVPDAARKNALRPVITLDGQSTQGQIIPREPLERLELRYVMKIGRRESRWTQTLYRRNEGVDIFAFDQQHFAIGVIPGWTANDQVAKVGSRGVSDALGRLDGWLERQRKGERVGDDLHKSVHATLSDLSALLPFAFLRNLDRLTFELADTMGVRPILQSPRVVTTAILRQGDTFHVSIDMQGDVLEAMPMRGIAPVAATGFLTLYGRIKNQLEGAFLETTTTRNPITVDALFRQAQRSKIRFATLHSSSIDVLEGFDLDATTKAELREQVMRRGQILLIPTQKVVINDVPHYGWWALQPLTGILRGNTHDALLSLRASNLEATRRASSPSIFEGTARLTAQQLSAITLSLDQASQYRTIPCQARTDIQTISRALCATKGAIKLPTLAECLKEGADTGDGLLSFTAPTCQSQVEPTRCGAVVANAFLEGKIAVGAPAAEGVEQHVVGYCR
ncbi:MAG: transglutaminase domain-containing protein [Bradymonadaceae bacterium]|nr:transglutaminase domain-containing protein [Lujinxingiaceae bacterium]